MKSSFLAKHRTDYKIPHIFVCLSVCHCSVCHCSYSDSFYSTLMKFCIEVDISNRLHSLWVKIQPSLPHFAPIFPPPPCILNGKVWWGPWTNCGSWWLTQHISGPLMSKVEKCYRPLFCPKNIKMEIEAFSTGIFLAKCLTQKYLSNHVRYRVGFKRPPIGNRVLQVQRSRDWWHNLTLKGHDLETFKAPYLNIHTRETIGLNWQPTGNHMMRVQLWHNHMTSSDSKKSWSQNLWSSVSQKMCETDSRFKLLIHRKPRSESQLVTWLMM